jgi:anaerobic selenocysteine-containing dehydrogenase
MLRLGLEDKVFIENYTHGFSDLLMLLEGYSLEEISEMTEVPIEVIQQLAYCLSDQPTSIYMGLGLQRYENGGNTIRFIDALAAVSGNIGIPGGGANYANLQVGQSFDFEELTLSNRKTAQRQFAIMTQAEEVLKAKDPEIQMIMVTCGNPLTQVPDTNVVKEAFTSVQTLVVIDQYMTDTAMIADYVLPAATSFEEEDFYYSSMYHHYVNYGPKLVSAPGEAKSDLWIWTELAERLGFGKDFDFSTEEWFNMTLRSLKNKGLTFEMLKEKFTLELPVEEIPWQEQVFQTTTKKFEFTSSMGQKKGDNGSLKWSFPAESKWTDPRLAEEFPYQLLTIHPMRSNHSQNYHLLATEPRVKVEIAANIAEKLGLAKNNYVRVWNERGEIKGFVEILQQSHPNIINIDEGIWSEYGGAVNQLTASRKSDNGLGSTLYDCLVNIEKIN